MNILFSVTNLSIGGAQNFVLNLANSISEEKEHKVFIYDHDPDYSNSRLYQFAKPEVKIYSCYTNGFQRFFLLRINGLLKRLGIGIDLRKKFNKKRFEDIVKQNRIDVVNSHMATSDFICADADLSNAQLIITLHGEYELYINEIKTMSRNIDNVLNLRPKLIYTADKNLEVIKEKVNKLNLTAKKIYIGINATSFKIKEIKRTDIKIDNNAFVIGMIGRGIPEKGWEFGIEVFKELKTRNSSRKLNLVLIGDGDYLRILVDKCGVEGVVLKQFEDDYQDYFSYYRLFDLFMFPTFFKGESVPTVIAESLYWNVPVIANDAGEIRNMLATPNGNAGIVIPKSELNSLKEQYVTCITDLFGNEAHYNTLKEQCKDAVKKFNIESIKREYLNVFKS